MLSDEALRRLDVDPTLSLGQRLRGSLVLDGADELKVLISSQLLLLLWLLVPV